MALTRKFLSALGIDEDKQQAIIDAHTETVEGLKNQAAQYKADAEKLTEVQAELKKAQDAVKNSGDAQKIQEAFDKYKADVQAKETKAAKEAAMRKLAKDAGLDEKGIERAVKYGLSSIELDEAGEVKDANDHIKALREEWPENIRAKVENNDPTPTPPAGHNDNGNGNRAAALYKAHQAALYGQTNETKGDN